MPKWWTRIQIMETFGWTEKQIMEELTTETLQRIIFVLNEKAMREKAEESSMRAQQARMRASRGR